MNTKNFIIAGLVGGVVDWILGFLFYGLIFSSVFPEGENMNMGLITLGCFSFGFLIAYIYSRWTDYKDFMSGAKAGAILGLIIAIYSNSFHWANMAEVDYKLFGLDILIGIVMTAIIGGAVAFVLGKLKD